MTAPTAALLGGMMLAIPAALADGVPKPWEIGMQAGVTPVSHYLESFFHELAIITTLIALFVTVLLAYVCIRFNARRHPVPSTTTHNTILEIVWTVVPVLILVAIAIPSFKLIFYMGEAQAQNPTMSLNVTAHQWYWTYAYPNQGNLTFDSNVIPDDKLKPGQPRLLSVDNRAVVPVDTTIRIFIRSTDVIHSFYVPSLGVQEYAMPGHVNEAWMRIEKPGVYRGQCNQLCGVNHAFMPIVVQAVSKADFAKWVQQAKKQFAGGGSAQGLASAG
ncbi:MAG TPA: cytochrome c oxidase subunit II [Stellaceae bacterium]|nr:cytochrome c oxidase subunit II [Stellaceae bacterium]